MQILKNKYISLALWIIFLNVVGYGIGIAMGGEIDSWYLALKKSNLTPPNYVFGIVWSILYIMIAISGWLIWGTDLKKQNLIKKLYISQLILNWLWTPLFFNLHLIGISFLCIIVIAILVCALILQSYKNIRYVSYLLIPYFLWISFASYLNFYIWINN